MILPQANHDLADIYDACVDTCPLHVRLGWPMEISEFAQNHGILDTLD